LISVYFQEKVFVNQVCEYCNNVINELVDVFRCAALSKKFIDVAGEQFSHGVLADIEINKHLERQLKLSHKNRVLQEALFYYTVVLLQQDDKVLNQARIGCHVFDC
jgi:hypothetical protein